MVRDIGDVCYTLVASVWGDLFDDKFHKDKNKNDLHLQSVPFFTALPKFEW
jgi:hypothetical protein